MSWIQTQRQRSGLLHISWLHKNSLPSVCLSGLSVTVPPHNQVTIPSETVAYSVSYLLVREPRHCVDILFLDHEGSQVGSVRGQEDDSKEGPDQDHDLTGCSFRVFNGD